MNHRSQLHEELMYGRPDRQEAAALIADYRAEVLAEAADVAVAIARREGSGGTEQDHRAAAAAAAVGAELRRRADAASKETRS